MFLFLLPLIHPHRMLRLLHQTPMLPLLLLRLRMPIILIPMNVPLTSPPRMKILIVPFRHRRLRDHIVRCLARGTVVVRCRFDVAGSAAAGGVLTGVRTTGAAFGAFANDTTVDVDGRVAADVAGAWKKSVVSGGRLVSAGVAVS